MSKRQCAWNYFGIPFQWDLEPRQEMEVTYGVSLREAVLGREDGLPLFYWETLMFGDNFDFEDLCEVAVFCFE